MQWFPAPETQQDQQWEDLDKGEGIAEGRGEWMGEKSRGERRAKQREERKRGKSRREGRADGIRRRWDLIIMTHHVLFRKWMTAAPLEACQHPCWPSSNLPAPHQSSLLEPLQQVGPAVRGFI